MSGKILSADEKEYLIKEMKNGAGANKLACRYNIPRSTLNYILERNQYGIYLHSHPGQAKAQDAEAEAEEIIKETLQKAEVNKAPLSKSSASDTATMECTCS